MNKHDDQLLVNLNKTDKKNLSGVFFVSGYHKKTENFLVGLLRNNEPIQVGEFSTGLSEDEREVLLEVILKNKTNSRGSIIKVDPAICLELQFKEMKKDKIVEAQFVKFRTDLAWEECTFARLLLQNREIHPDVALTSLNKPIWSDPFVNKDEYLVYLFNIAPYMSPFLHNRTVTTLRFPHGVGDEVFYQKNCPDYAPRFIQTHKDDDINYIVCNDWSTLIWLGNQLALEFHVPFHTISNRNPREIVFDLDPPSRDFFHLAVKAAKEMKSLFDKFNLISFPKLSGNKGLQIHIPMFNTPLTFEQTRIFTSFIAEYLVEKFPKDFTVERMKKKRGNKLYIDYVQHWYGKTIICPYSLRGKEGATVAAPLFWEEVNEELSPANYHLFNVVERVKKLGCPFKDYFKMKNSELIDIITSLQTNR